MLSALDCSCGSTSPTVRSTSTPLIMRKHLRVAGRGVSVSRTSLEVDVSEISVVIVFCLERSVWKKDHEDNADAWSGIECTCGDQ